MADEPTGNLDSKTSREVIELFRQLNQDHRITVILVTHDQNVARNAKRTLVLRDGLVVEDTTDFARAVRVLHAEAEDEGEGDEDAAADADAHADLRGVAVADAGSAAD
jgi:ABC-type methionine transport system ATPase subunit